MQQFLERHCALVIPTSHGWVDAPDVASPSLHVRILSAENHNVPLRAIEAHRLWHWGRRIFLSIFDSYPLTQGKRLIHLDSKVLNDELRRRWQRRRQKHTVSTMNDSAQ